MSRWDGECPGAALFESADANRAGEDERAIASASVGEQEDGRGGLRGSIDRLVSLHRLASFPLARIVDSGSRI